MTFIRRLLDMLNRDNCNSKASNILSSQKQDKIVSLYSIRSFWKSHPQIYQNSLQEATIEEYLLYGKMMMVKSTQL